MLLFDAFRRHARTIKKVQTARVTKAKAPKDAIIAIKMGCPVTFAAMLLCSPFDRMGRANRLDEGELSLRPYI